MKHYIGCYLACWTLWAIFSNKDKLDPGQWLAGVCFMAFISGTALWAILY